MRELILTFLVGAGASVISGLIGAGGGAVRVPYLLFLGLPPQIAIGTGKFGAFGVTIGSIAKFKNTGYIRREFVLIITLISLPAAYLGLNLLLSISDELIKTIVAAALILTTVILFLNQSLGLKARITSPLKRFIGYVADFFIGLFQSGFSSGIGLLSLPTYMYFFGMTAIEANATSKIPGLVKSILIFAIVVASGIVNWGHAIAIMLGSMVGSYLGAHLAIKQGNKFVKTAYGVMLIIMSLKLLYD